MRVGIVRTLVKSLLAAVPHPNPEVEKRRKLIAYDQKASGVDYSKGTAHLVEGTHTVLATDDELARWTNSANVIIKLSTGKERKL